MTLGKLTKTVLTPQCKDFNTLNKNYNLNNLDNFSTIICCSDENDVINALKFAKKNNTLFKIIPSHEDFNLNFQIDNKIIIDISKINFVEINNIENTATIGGGSSIKDVYNKLIEHNYTLPCETLSTIGISNISTTGGLGFASRDLGLTLDNIIEIQLIDFKYKKIIANSYSHSELFWALRGNYGGNYGIITSLKYKLMPISQISIFTASWNISYAKDIIKFWQNFAYSSNSKLNTELLFKKDNSQNITITCKCSYMGELKSLSLLLSPLLKISHPLNHDCFNIPYNKSFKVLFDENLNNRQFIIKNFYIHENIPNWSINDFIHCIQNTSLELEYTIKIIPLSEKIKSLSSNKTSFPYRNAKYYVQIRCICDNSNKEQAILLWLKKLKEILNKATILLPPEETSDYSKKLQKLKFIYDPLNFFYISNGIKPDSSLLKDLTGTIIEPTNSLFNIVRQCYNLRFNYYPVAIVYCYTTKDIINSIIWAKKNNIKIRPRCSGCDYEGFSINDNYLIIDLSKMKKFSMDKINNTVTIEAGFTLGEIYEKLYEEGYQFTGGTYSNIGISGLISGGGIGLSSRLYGLCCDNLLEFTLVTFEGNIIKANTFKNSSLFWACCGANYGNFGIFTEFTFKINPIDKITYINICWPKKMFFQVIKIFQKTMPFIDKKVTCQLSINSTTACLIGYSYTDVSSTQNIIKDILKVPNTIFSVIKHINFIDAINSVSNQYYGPNRFKTSSTIFYDFLNDDALKNLLNQAEKIPYKSIENYITFTPLGGSIKENKNNNTSFAHRDALFILQYTSIWKYKENDNENIQWVKSLRISMLNHSKFAYPNFPDKDIKQCNISYYKQNLYRLKEVKNFYNPSNLFDFPQSLNHNYK